MRHLLLAVGLVVVAAPFVWGQTMSTPDCDNSSDTTVASQPTVPVATQSTVTTTEVVHERYWETRQGHDEAARRVLCGGYRPRVSYRTRVPNDYARRSDVHNLSQKVDRLGNKVDRLSGKVDKVASKDDLAFQTTRVLESQKKASENILDSSNGVKSGLGAVVVLLACGIAAAILIRH